MGQELRVGKDDNAFGVGHCCRCAYCCVTHTRLTALCPGLPGWAGTRKVKPTWILLKQETVSGSEIRWAICKSAPCSRQITTSAPHRSVFLQAGCPSCRPTNSVKALKADYTNIRRLKMQLWIFSMLMLLILARRFILSYISAT